MVAGRSSLTLGAQKDPCGTRSRAEVGKEWRKGGRWPRREWTRSTSYPPTHTHTLIRHVLCIKYRLTFLMGLQHPNSQP